MTATSATAGVLVEAVLDLDRRDVLAAGDDHVLLAVGDDRVGTVEVAAVAGVEPAALERLGRLVGLVPVAVEDVVRPGQDLALLVDARCAPRRRARRPGPAACERVGGVEVVPLPRRPVDGEEGGGLGEAVDLDELPAELGLDPLDGLRRRRRAGHHDAHRALVRAPARPARGARRGGGEDGGHHGRGPAQQGHALGARRGAGSPRRRPCAARRGGRPWRSPRRACPSRCSGTWASVCSSTSRSLTPVCQPKIAALSQQLRWVSCTPLGRAVVPEV